MHAFFNPGFACKPDTFLGDPTMNVVEVPKDFKPMRLPPMLTMPPKRTVIIAGYPDDAFRVYIHYLQNGSVPCFGEGCPYCPMPSREQAYIDCFNLQMSAQGKQELIGHVLPVPAMAWDLVTLDLYGKIVEVWREPSHKKGKVKFKVVGTMKDFKIRRKDLRERIMTMWGFRVDALQKAAGTQAGRVVPPVME